MKKLLIFIFLFVTVFIGVNAEESSDKADWTVLVYMCADNDLEPFAIIDMNEMEQIGSTENLNIITMMDRWDGYQWGYGTDGPERKKSNSYKMHEYSVSWEGDWTGTRVYRVKKDDDQNKINSELLEDWGEINTGDPKNLEKFIQYGAEKYPAENYFVIIWNHGAGIDGVGFDDGNMKGQWTDGKWVSVKHDSISGPEMGDVFAKVVGKITDKNKDIIDMVGFDACLMSMYSNHVELAYNNVETIVGSQELEPGNGWPYMNILYYLKRLTDEGRDISTGSFAHWIVKQYIDSYDGDQVTLAGINVNPADKVGAVNQKIDALITELLKDDDNMLKLHDSVKKSQRYNTGNSIDSSFVYYVDLIDMMENIELDFDGDISEKAKEVNAEINNQKIIVANQSKGSLVADSNGIGIYFPLYRRARNAKGEYYLLKPYIKDEYNGYKTDRQTFRNFKFGKESKWDDMLNKYYEVLETKSDEEVGVVKDEYEEEAEEETEE